MKKITCVLAILAAASTAAVAKDLKQDQKATAPAVAATQMSDAEMDKVTAGAGADVPDPGFDNIVFLPSQLPTQSRAPGATPGAPAGAANLFR